MDKQKCTYKDCQEPVNSPHDETLCVFHAPKDKKGITVEEFKNLIFDKISKNNFMFRGYIFPGTIVFREGGWAEARPLVFNNIADFSEARFTGNVDFSGAVFEGKTDLDFPWGGSAIACVNFDGAVFERKVDFSKAEFKSGQARFIETEFSGKEARFSGTRFIGGIGYFNKAKFMCGYTAFDGSTFENGANFKNTLFSKGDVGFWNCKFLAGGAYFWNADFRGGEVDFRSARFIEGNVEFNDVKFSGGRVSFLGTHFEENLSIINSVIAYDMDLTYATFGESSLFQFRSPEFIKSSDKTIEDERYPHIILNRIRFKPFATYFEGIKDNEKIGTSRISDTPLLIFRYCQLKDVYFTNNDMSLFSFYKSSFDKARFISSRWSEEKDTILRIPFKRKNVIPEEKFLLDSADKKKFMVEDLNGYEDVASLYRRMKTALDNTKDYQQASWFYFNEFEMKRKALEEEIENSLPKRRIFQRQPFLWTYRKLKKIFNRYIFYFSYRVFAGFGEKPLWSFYWFLLGILGFTTLNYCIGLKKGFTLPGGTIDYVDATFWDSLIFTIYRIIPANYLPFKQMFDIPHGFWGMLVPFLNTAVLIIFIAFIAIGLKRHFRRF